MRWLLLACFAFLVHAASAQDLAVYERGHAARYGDGATGSATASGEPYNPERMTIAHPTLPFGTLVQVTNLGNGASVTARVNDRRRPAAGVLVHLSARAADQLGLPARGGQVELRLDPAELALVEAQRARREREARPPVVAAAALPVAYDRFTVQVASFREEGRARALAAQIRGAYVLPVTVDGQTLYRVCFGVFESPEAAAEGQTQLRAQGVEGFVKGLDAPPGGGS